MNAKIQTLYQERDMYLEAALTAERNDRAGYAQMYLDAAIWAEQQAQDLEGEQERLAMEQDWLGRPLSIEEMLDMREEIPVIPGRI